MRVYRYRRHRDSDTQALLYRTIGAFGLPFSGTHSSLRCSSANPRGQTVLRRIVTVNIGPSLVNQKMGLWWDLRLFQNSYGREIIIIGFNDHCGTVFHSQQVTKVFP